MEIGIENGRLFSVFLGLFVFGVLYAYLIYWMRRRNWLEPYTAFMVVFGTVITLTINKFIHHPNWTVDLLLELASFAASGLPMIAGSIVTHSVAIERDQSAN